MYRVRRTHLCWPSKRLIGLLGLLSFSITLILLVLEAKSIFIRAYYGSNRSHKTIFLTHNNRERLKDLGINLTALAQDSFQSCVHPELDLWHPELRKYFNVNPKPLVCAEDKDWVYVKNGTFKISSAAIRKHGEISCEYIPQLQGSTDFVVKNGMSIRPMKDGMALRSDVFQAICAAEDSSKYVNTHLGVAYNKKIHSRYQAPSDSSATPPMNILMFGLDSTSRMSWIRNLPRTHQYVINTLGGVAMEGYNIVGDGTPQALLPILTGYSEQDLPEARRGQEHANSVDNHPWIWQDLHKLGYVTQWGEDGASVGTFTLRMLGFNKQPVDHYMRTFYLVAEKAYQYNQAYCLGSVPRHINMLNYMRHLYEMYPRQPKFSFLFHSEFTHDGYSEVKVMDNDVVRFLQDFYERGYLNNTLLVMMADHGARFNNVRHTVQGKYEERMPYMAFRLPPHFEKQHPNIVRNLFVNSRRLTTPYDIHETFRHVLRLTASTSKLYNDNYYKKRRGQSLFKEISASRTCADVGIEPHWCACLNWKTASVTDSKVKRSANELVNAINTLTTYYSNVCDRLTLTNVVDAVTYTPNAKLLKFKSSVDIDGRVPDLSDDMTLSEVLYQVTVVVSPGGGRFEATVRHLVHDDSYYVNEREISRINKYGNQAHCVQQQAPHLRQFCHCTAPPG